ncbi:MAG: hypothetical protein ACFFD2_07835 [Promethearchaeota archaeon]
MNNNWDVNDWDYSDDLKMEKGPFIREIILPPTLYEYALKRGAETYKEVGFYLIGIFKKGICYIHDIIEFDYSEQSGGFIESSIARYLRLKAGVPLGLKIVGHMHKHPGFTQYSTTDKRNFLQYGNANPLNAFLIFMIEPHEKISGYTATAEKIFPIEVNIRELTIDETLLEKELKIKFTTKILLPKNSANSDFNLTFSENIGSESLKFLSRSTIYINGISSEKKSEIIEDSKIEIIPRKVVEIEKIGRNSKINYRIFMEETDTITKLEKILKQLVYIPQKKGYDIIFYECERKLPKSTLIKEIEHPIVWSLEKSVLLLVFKKFYYFWKDFFKILKQKKEEGVKKDTNKPEIENREAEQQSQAKKNKISDSNSIKKQRDYKRESLDYYI